MNEPASQFLQAWRESIEDAWDLLLHGEAQTKDGPGPTIPPLVEASTVQKLKFLMTTGNEARERIQTAVQGAVAAVLAIAVFRPGDLTLSMSASLTTPGLVEYHAKIFRGEIWVGTVTWSGPTGDYTPGMPFESAVKLVIGPMKGLVLGPSGDHPPIL